MAVLNMDFMTTKEATKLWNAMARITDVPGWIY